MGYTVLVVDDEDIERMALAKIIRREFPDNVRVHTLPNGMEMLKFLENQNADIAIVDIDMPGFNGIETVRKLRQGGNRIKIIINTAYSTFQYAVDAIKLEVDDYLVKPLKREKFIEVLHRCVGKIEEEKLRVNREKDMLKALKPAVAGAFLRAVKTDQLQRENWNAYLDAMAIKLEYAAIIIIAIDGWAELGASNQQKIMDRTTAFLNMEFDCMTCNLMAQGIMALVVQPPEQHRRVFYERLQKTLSSICDMIDTTADCRACVGVGAIAKGVLQLHTSYRQAMEVLQKNDRQGVLFYDYVRTSEHQSDFVTDKRSQSKIVRAACLIVRSNYQEDISLDSVAEKVGITPSYLSRLFKKEMDINFQDYLTDVRIEKAVQLLHDESMTGRALAHAVGYNNYTYFCKIFKRETGKTIGEYRESLGIKNVEQEE